MGETKTNLFTVILEWAGGTYITQVSAESPERARALWVKKIKRGNNGLALSARASIGKSLIDSDVVAIRGCKSVYCATSVVNKKLALVNIIRTDAK